MPSSADGEIADPTLTPVTADPPTRPDWPTSEVLGPAGGAEPLPADGAGWYPFGKPSKVAWFDGEIWSGATATAPGLGPPPPWRRPRHSMATLRWLWVMLAGQALCILSALLAAATGVNALAWTSIVGFAVFMTGSVLLVDWRVQFHELPGLRRLVGLGIAAGIVASAVSIPIELAAVHGLGIGPVLWLSGPIEETAKLLVPIALLAWGVKALREPRAGLLVVVVSAATFGAIEGAVWESRRSDIWLHLEMAIVRPGAELIHPFLTGFAAAVIWLAARRAGRVVTRSGVLAFALIVVVHSVHDGIATLLLLRKGERIGIPSVYSPGVAITRGVASWLVLFLQAVAVYVLLRHAARELVGPTHLATSPPQWRPRIKPWGLRRGARAHAIATNLNARR